MNIICIKLRSNSGLMLLDSQLKEISKKYNIPFDFLKPYKKERYEKIWIDAGDEGGSIVASQFDGCKIINSLYTGKVTTEYLNSVKPIKNPKRVGQDIPEEVVTIPIDLKSIICINLKIPQDQLDIISDYYGIESSYFASMKAGGTKKIWIQLGQTETVCYLDSDNLEDVVFNKSYLPMTSRQRKSILLIEPVKIPQLRKAAKEAKAIADGEVPVVVKKQKTQEKFDVDEILDKISNHGINSLTPQEKKFLDSLGK